jgi:diguanylate cyclase (GGDEF)-like protein
MINVTGSEGMDFQLKYANELASLKENEDKIEIFRTEAMKYLSSNLEELKKIIDGLLIFSEENKLHKTKAWAYYYQGWYNFDTTHYDRAVTSFLKSYEIFNNIMDKDGIVYACNGLTNVYCQIGQLNLANEWGLKGITLAEEIGNKNALITLLLNTGINYIQMQHYDKAKEIFSSMELMFYELTDQHRVSCLLAMAEIEIHIGDSVKSLSYIEEALKNEEKSLLITDISEIHKLKGMAHIKLMEYDVAENEFVMACNSAEQQGLTYEKCSAMVEWANLCVKVGRKQEAVEKLNEAASICSLKDINVLLKEIYFKLYKIYKELNLTGKALEFLEKYKLIDDKMYNYEQNQLIAKVSIKNARREVEQYKLLYDRTELLSTIGQKIISNLNINSIIDIINDEINKLIETDYFGIAVYDKEKDQISYHFAGLNEKLYESVQFSKVDYSTFAGYCIKTKNDIVLGNVSREYKKFTRVFPRSLVGIDESQLKSMIYTPMIINDKVVGAMTVQSMKENSYDKNDLNMLKIIANYTAIAIENAISYKKVEEIATYDQLTRFLSKHEIVKLGKLIFDKCKDNQIKFSAVMIDVDNFKMINDTYGHVYGDNAISLLSETITRSIRNTDYIGRYGGDEFLLICPDAGEHEAFEVAERIRKNVENSVFSIGEGIHMSLTISLGVHQCTDCDSSFDDVIKRADKSLYFAKGSKNKVVLSE